MQPKDRKLLLTLAIVLLGAWFVGDFLLGAAVGDLQRQTKQDAARQARSDSNRHMMGGNSGYSGGSRNMGPLELASFHETIRLPLRYAAAAGLILLLIFAPAVIWTNSTRQYLAQNPRVLVGAILIFISVAMFAIAHFIASGHSMIFTQTRPVTGASLEMDRQQRTMTNPPAHLNPNVPRSGRVSSITFGADPVEQFTVSQVDQSVTGYVDIIRLLAAIIGILGLVYACYGGQQRAPQAAPTEPISNPNPPT